MELESRPHDVARGIAGSEMHDGAFATPQHDETPGLAGQTIGDTGRGPSSDAIRDPAGARDRQSASRELASRFQVVGDDFIGPRAGNQVSAAEYEQLVHTYSDVRLGRGDLTMDTSMIADPKQAAAYREGTMTNIAELMMTEGGRAQVERMQNNVLHDDAGKARTDAKGHDIHHHTTIRPLFRDANGDGNQTNDPTTAADYDNGNAMGNEFGVSGEGPTGKPDGSQQQFSGRVGGDPTAARGKGTDSTLWWNPTANDGSPADVILAHEMNHSYNETQGTIASGNYTGPGVDHGVANAERQATGLANTGSNPHDDPALTENEYIRERNARGGAQLKTRPDYNAPL